MVLRPANVTGKSVRGSPLMEGATSGQSVMTARDYGPRDVARQKFHGQKARSPAASPRLPSTTDTTGTHGTLVD